jgi:hypothetical protein
LTHRYGKQIEKLREVLEAEGRQLSDAREEIASLTMTLQLAASQGIDLGEVDSWSKTKRRGGGMGSSGEGGGGKGGSNSKKTKHLLRGAADLILLERLAAVEEVRIFNLCLINKYLFTVNLTYWYLTFFIDSFFHLFFYKNFLQKHNCVGVHERDG